MSERRGFQRFDCAAVIRINVPHECGIAEAQVYNVSSGGAGFFAGDPLSIGGVVRFELLTEFLSAGVAGRGIIRHAQLAQDRQSPFWKTGLEFVDIDKNAVIQLIARIQARLSDSVRMKHNVRPIDFIPY